MNIKLISVLAASLLSAAPAFSDTVTLDFEGVASLDSIGQFYNGGAGGNYGVSFELGALAVTNDEFGPYFSNLATPGSTSVMAPAGADAALNSAGFFGAVTFNYSARQDVTISIFSGLNGTGLIDTFTLLANTQACSDSLYCNWQSATLNFYGVAQSIQFGGAWSADPEIGGLAMFDDVTISTVPLPAAAWLLLSGLGGLGVFSRRRQVA